MGNETIFYYVTEETITDGTQYTKKRFWQKIRLKSFVVEKEEMTIVTILIPILQKEWKKEKLLRLMQKSAETHPYYSRGARILMQPAVQLLLAGQSAQSAQTDTFLSIGFPMTEKILWEQFPLQSSATWPQSVVLLMGTLFFPEEQIQHFAKMIQPYLPRINALTIFYEKEEAMKIGEEMENGVGADEDAGTDMEPAGDVGAGYLEEGIHEYTEELYYEYGLVSQVICGADASGGQHSRLRGQSPVLFLDYGYSGTMPSRMLKEGGIYLDVASSEQKEALFRRKYRGIFYHSPRKYLDTVVKSGYDK